MTKIAAVLLLVILVWILLERALKALASTPQVRQARAIWQAMNGGAKPRAAGGGASRSTTQAPSRLVRCSACGTHVVEARAQHAADGRPCCSRQCVEDLSAARRG